jgi:DNA-binding NarL/FixJ family response regulator
MKSSRKLGYGPGESGWGRSAIAVTEPRSKKHRIIVADDQEEVLQIVTATLRDGYQIVGLAANGRDLLDLVQALKPDIVVLDISMPLINGIEVVFRLRTDGCCAKLVCITVHEDRDFVEAAFAAGAHGYVLKSRLASDLIPAIKNALDNGFFVSPGV